MPRPALHITRSLITLLACLLAIACQAESPQRSSLPAIEDGQDFFVVLQYHHVDDTTPAPTSVRVEQFEQHLAYLDEHDFNVLALDEALDSLQQGRGLPDRSIVISFDDSYDSIYREAFPRLQARGFAFTVFVNTDVIDEGRRGMLSWDQLRQMRASGGLIANHSISHPHFPRRRDQMGDDWHDWARQQISHVEQRLIDELGETPKLFAWPYGEYDSDSLALLDEMDLIGFGQHSGVVGRYEDWRALPRFAVNVQHADLDSLALKMHAKPLPVTSAQPDETKLEAEDRQPVLELTLSDNAPSGGWKASINCFVGGQGRTEVQWLDEQQLSLQASRPLPAGRARYNCTARDDDGRFFWYSRQWLLPREDGSWPPE